jgi:redox-sensitive bicupin YhaK (pirin superfamily)
MIRVSPKVERDRTTWSWLESCHTFPLRTPDQGRIDHWRALRFLNEEHIAPGMGFGMRPDRDLEILTLVLSGTLLHKDSLGNECLLRSGDLRLLSTGAGMLHSEMNISSEHPLHLLQIGISAREPSLSPACQVATFAPECCRQSWCVLASPEETGDAFLIRQDVWVYRRLLDRSETAGRKLAPGRTAWLHVISGSVLVSEHTLKPGDGAGMENEEEIVLKAEEAADVLLLDLGW